MNNFIQESNNTCGVTVVRNIIFDIKHVFIDEVSILETIKYFPFSKNDWKSKFLSQEGSMPTEFLKELLDHYQIDSKIEYDIQIDYINTQVLAVLQLAPNHYHAIYIKEVNKMNKSVLYVDPADGKEKLTTFEDIESKRNMKHPEHVILELLVPKYI